MLWKREDGAALITVFFVLTIVSILVVALSNSSFFDARFALRDEHSVQAHYLALSGVNLATDLILENSFFFSARTEPYYLYGDLESGFTVTDSKPADDIAPMRLEVTVSEDVESGVKGIVICSQATVGETVSVYEDLELTLSFGANPSLPPIDLSQDPKYVGALDGGPLGLEWYKHNGKLENNVNMDVSDHVKMGDGVSYSITDDNNSGHKLRAPGIYFSNEPESFRIEHNVDLLEIETNYLYFAGDVVIVNHGNDPRVIRLNTYIDIDESSEEKPILGSELRKAGYEEALTEKNYGLIYLANGLIVMEKNEAKSRIVVPPGYYYFPHGVNLRDLSESDITPLIKARPFQEIERTYR